MFEVLADVAGVGRVVRCGACPALHVSLGPLTLRLTPGEFESARALLRAAAERLARDQGPGVVRFEDDRPVFRSIDEERKGGQ